MFGVQITKPNLPDATMPDQVHDTNVKTGTGKVNPDHNLIFAEIAAQIIMIHTEAAQGHNIRIITATTGTAHNAHAAPIDITAIHFAMTHHINHISDHPHIQVLQLTTPEIAVGHTYNHPTILQGEICTGQVHIPADDKASHTSRRT